jgi:type 1 fimbriae regulatory protein FimE
MRIIDFDPPRTQWTLPESEKSTEKRTVPTRKANAAYRGREHLTEAEVERTMRAARKRGRYGVRDAAAILLAYRHGLRVSELCDLRWDQVDLRDRRLSLRRAKGGIAGVHPLAKVELKALAALEALRAPGSVYVLENERGDGPLQPGAIRKIVKRAGKVAGLEVDVHPHMLRHACGFVLANKKNDTRAIQEYLGHRSIQSTQRYTALAAGRFDDLVW